jgi:hypothetical protein
VHGNADKRSILGGPKRRTSNPHGVAVEVDRPTPSNCRARALRNSSPVLSPLGSAVFGSYCCVGGLSLLKTRNAPKTLEFCTGRVVSPACSRWSVYHFCSCLLNPEPGGSETRDLRPPSSSARSSSPTRPLRTPRLRRRRREHRFVQFRKDRVELLTARPRSGRSATLSLRRMFGTTPSFGAEPVAHESVTLAAIIAFLV